MVLMVYATSKGPRSNCLLADMKQIDQTTKVIRHLAPLDDFFLQDWLVIDNDSSRKQAYIILTPLNIQRHFYILKLGFTWVCIIFLISAQKHRLWVLVRTASPFFLFLLKNIDCGYSLERGEAVLMSTHSRNKKKISDFFI